MRIDYFGRTDVRIADHGRQAGDRQLELFRIGRAGKKQTLLRGAWRGRIGSQDNFENR
jgi:hypothetical protein